MKKILFAFLLIPCLAWCQQKTVVEFVDFNFDIDSTTATVFTEKKIMFEKDLTSFTNDRYLTSGYYNIDIYIDSTAGQKAGTDSATLGQTDSLFIYVKPHVKGQNTAVYNDSTGLTNGFSGAGFDFEIDQWYHFEFQLPAKTGYSLFFRRNVDAGAMNIRCIATK